MIVSNVATLYASSSLILYVKLHCCNIILLITVKTVHPDLCLDAWSGEADISESDAAPSRPSSAAAMYRQALTKQKNRPATAPGKRPLAIPLTRPLTAPSPAEVKPKRSDDTIPSTSRIESRHQDNTSPASTSWSSDNKQLAITNGV